MDLSLSTCKICNQEHTVIAENTNNLWKKLCTLCKHEIKRTNQFLAQLEKSSAFLTSTTRKVLSAVRTEPAEQLGGENVRLWIDYDKIILGPESPGASPLIEHNYSSCGRKSPPIDIKIEHSDEMILGPEPPGDPVNDDNYSFCLLNFSPKNVKIVQPDNIMFGPEPPGASPFIRKNDSFCLQNFPPKDNKIEHHDKINLGPEPPGASLFIRKNDSFGLQNFPPKDNKIRHSDKINLGPETPGASPFLQDNSNFCAENSAPMDVKIEYHGVKEERSNEDSCSGGTIFTAHNSISDEVKEENCGYISSMDIEEITPETFNIAKLDVLPEKSRHAYERIYLDFMTWCQAKKISRYSETVLLAYFSYLAQAGYIGSLWTRYSMLKATLQLHHNVDIGTYSKVFTLIKQKLEGHTTKRSRVLKNEHIKQFLAEAPNAMFLMAKVVLIFGVTGAMRKHEILNLEISDVLDLGSKFIVTVRSPKKGTDRLFTIVDNESKTLLSLIREYVSLRPWHIPHNRFFIYCKNNRCSTQPAGINLISKLPSKIAAFLKLDQPNLYTGHCFRRSSASVFAEDFAAVKGLGR